MPIIKPPTAWSWSRYYDYSTCPFKFKCKHIMRLPEPKAPAMARGIEIHQAAEDFVQGRTTKLHPNLKPMSKDFKLLRQITKDGLGVGEEKWGLNKNWEETGYWADDIWLRLKMDFHYFSDDGLVCHVIDYKTGKVRPYEEHEDQMELYGLCGLAFYDVPEVQPQLWFSDHDVKITGPDAGLVAYTQADFERLKAKWNKKVRPMFADRTYAPKMNYTCRWCHFRKANNGPCKY